MRRPTARRCLVPATGWYEWQKINAKTKRPYHFKPKAEPFAFAGVYDVWKADGKSSITSFAIVTTDAASSTVQYHDRMPSCSRTRNSTNGCAARPSRQQR